MSKWSLWNDAVARDLIDDAKGAPGALLPILAGPADIGRLQLERHVCVDTTAAGGNASLMAAAV